MSGDSEAPTAAWSNSVHCLHCSRESCGSPHSGAGVVRFRAAEGLAPGSGTRWIQKELEQEKIHRMAKKNYTDE
jgi:hypothetical protein